MHDAFIFVNREFFGIFREMAAENRKGSIRKALLTRA
jgi:hypothetical protein